MKILFDQNISFRILKKLKNRFPGARQVRKLGLENSTDKQIWKFAKDNNFTIVTYDGDFCDIAAIKGHPPKIIWLRFDNKANEELAKILIYKVEVIRSFISDEKFKDLACLEID